MCNYVYAYTIYTYTSDTSIHIPTKPRIQLGMERATFCLNLQTTLTLLDQGCDRLKAMLALLNLLRARMRPLQCLAMSDDNTIP